VSSIKVTTPLPRVTNQKTLGLDAAIAIGHDPPETTPLVDDEDVELGFCVGDWRLDVDEASSLDVEVELVDEVVEFELVLELEDDELE
jgi:hypothetical protein